MKKTSIFWVILFLFSVTGLSASGQQSAQPPQYRQEATPVSVHQVSPHVYEVRGGDGANCSLIVGEKEAFVIDAKMTAKSAKEMTAAIKKITGKPISHIILTHSDGDHVNGLSGFSGTTEIIAHINTAKHIEKANESGTEKVPLPNETFDSRMSVYSGKFQVDLLYFGPAHTDGDIVILVPDDKIAIVGDLFFKGQDPLIHMNKNGNSFGLVNVLGRITELDVQTYLSGHAEPVAKAEVEELRKRIIDNQKQVKALVEEGKTLDEVKKSLGISAEQSRWPSLTEVIYLELTGDDQKKTE
jgi:glyoxylase-like metal-dependent hydrolase (beta-lactamase superfamily II)